MRQLRRLVQPEMKGWSDRELLQQFAEQRQEAAFEVLVHRHGPLVLGVCRRLLRHEHDAEDAFQATFLVLARKAATMSWQTSVSTWLYAVACRVAGKARSRRRTRFFHERRARQRSPVSVEPQDNGAAVGALLDEELDRLPERYRFPILLCCLHGKRREEAAKELRWSAGAIKGRLERGRQLLRQRLARRGIVLSTLSLASLLSQQAFAAVPRALADVTATAATAIVSGKTAALGLVSAPVAALSEGVLNAMFWSKLRFAVVVLVALGLVGTGAGTLVHRLLAYSPAQAKQKNPAAAAPADQAKKDGKQPEKKPDVTGVIAAVADAGQRLTLELPAKIKGDPPTTIEIRINDKTKLAYFGVDSAGETPTVGYVAQVWLVEGSTDTAAGVRMGRKDISNQKGPDFSGVITAVSTDLKNITLEIPSQVKGEPTTKTDLKLTDKTKFSYFGVDSVGQLPTIGYSALVWLVENSKDTAAGIRLGLKNGGGQAPDDQDVPKKGKKQQGPSLQGVLKAIDPAKGEIQVGVASIKDGKKEKEEKSFPLAKDVRVVLEESFSKDQPLPEGKLTDLTPDTIVTLRLAEDKKTVAGISARGPSIHGSVSAVDVAGNAITLALKEDGQRVDKTFVLDKQAKILLNDGLGSKDQPVQDREGKLADLSDGTGVAIQLSVDRKRGLGVRVFGKNLRGTLKGLDMGNNTITIEVKEDGALVEKTFTLAKNARLLDLLQGTGIVVHLSVFDKQIVVSAHGLKEGSEEKEQDE